MFLNSIEEFDNEIQNIFQKLKGRKKWKIGEQISESGQEGQNLSIRGSRRKEETDQKKEIKN